MSKGKDAGMGKICPSKPTWFDSRAAILNMSGALISAIYALCVQAWPVVLLNAALLVINGVKLITDRYRIKKGAKI